jgi:hypothetical protein
MKVQKITGIISTQRKIGRICPPKSLLGKLNIIELILYMIFNNC